MLAAAARHTNPKRQRGTSRTPRPTLHVLCRSLPQLREVLAAGITNRLRRFRRHPRISRGGRRSPASTGATICLATPRIQKPDEIGIFHALAKHGADGILVRNLAGLRFFRERGIPTIADFSLNAANELTAQYLIEQGRERITPSYDLNREQLLDLVAAVPPAWLEVVIHQHMPMFHMEHCVFCAVLSPGTNKTQLRPPLRRAPGQAPRPPRHGASAHRRRRLPQHALQRRPAKRRRDRARAPGRGVRHFRVELLDDRGQPLVELLGLYQRLLAGDVTGQEVWTRLKATNRVGVTRGTLEERRHPLAIV